MGNVAVISESAQLRIRRSKTDQRGKGVLVALFRGNGPCLCPVMALEQFFLLRPQMGSLLLVHGDGSVLSHFQFVSVFRKCLSAAGVHPSDFASHSFHISAPTEASWWGLGENAVKQIDRWESTRFRLYVRPHLL